MKDNEKILFALKLIKEACEHQADCNACLLNGVPNSVCLTKLFRIRDVNGNIIPYDELDFSFDLIGGLKKAND